MSAFQWPRLRDLPESERQAFTNWICEQTRPIEPSLPETEEYQDFYFRHDYYRWRETRESTRRVLWY